jgi:predicted RNA binding protein YcfA (HicA-like mRNA interferase family)
LLTSHECHERSGSLSPTWNERGWHLVDGGKGSHRKFAHARSQRKVMLSGQSGADALRYQEKQVKQAIREVQK